MVGPLCCLNCIISLKYTFQRSSTIDSCLSSYICRLASFDASQPQNESLVGACCQALGHCVMPKYVDNLTNLVTSVGVTLLRNKVRAA